MTLRLTIALIIWLLPSLGRAQDSVRRASPVSIAVTSRVSPLDSLPISTSERGITPVQTLASQSLDQAVRAVPGLQIDNRSNYALGDRITIRGAGARSFFGVRGIRVLLDEIPLTFADGQSNMEIIDPSQLSSAVVLRGPTAALFGNASGGALLLASRMPSQQGTITSASATFGSNDYRRLTLSFNDRGDELGFGAYATYDSSSGYRAWNGMSALHLGTHAYYTLDDDLLTFRFNSVKFSAQNPGSLPADSLASSRRSAFAQNLDRRTGKDGSQVQASLSWLRLLPSGELNTSLYSVLRNVSNPTPQQVVDLDRNLFGLRSHYRLSTQDNSIEFAFAGDVQYQFDDRKEYRNVKGNRDSLQTDQEENIYNFGLGVHSRFRLIEALSVTASARYDLLGFEAKDHLVSAINRDESGKVSMSALSPSVGFTYRGLERHQIYLNAGQSFESPTSTELANRPDGVGGFNTDLKPQRSTSVELGVKGDFTYFTYSLAGFLGTVKDALIPFQVPDQPGRDFYRNAGLIHNDGLELELAAIPIEDLTIHASYAYIRSEFADFVTATDTLNGKAQPGVIPNQLACTIIYLSPEGLYLDLSAKLAAKVAVNDLNTAYSTEYSVLDFKAGYNIHITDVGQTPLRIEPFVHVNNLLDRKYVGSYAINAFGRRYYEPAPERTIAAGIRVSL